MTSPDLHPAFKTDPSSIHLLRSSKRSPAVEVKEQINPPKQNPTKEDGGSIHSSDSEGLPRVSAKNISKALDQAADDTTQMLPPGVPGPKRTALGQLAKKLEGASGSKSRTAAEGDSDPQVSETKSSESGMETENRRAA